MIDIEQYWLPISLAFIWGLVWKYFALWRAAKRNQKSWFVVMLILNTAGILEIFYLFVFSKEKPKEQN
jgi:Family of unknown function (DUF5652)